MRRKSAFSKREGRTLWLIVVLYLIKKKGMSYGSLNQSKVALALTFNIIGQIESIAINS